MRCWQYACGRISRMRRWWNYWCLRWWLSNTSACIFLDAYGWSDAYVSVYGSVEALFVRRRENCSSRWRKIVSFSWSTLMNFSNLVSCTMSSNLQMVLHVGHLICGPSDLLALSLTQDSHIECRHGNNWGFTYVSKHILILYMWIYIWVT